MRPGHEAPENDERLAEELREYEASMRPGHEAPENRSGYRGKAIVFSPLQ